MRLPRIAALPVLAAALAGCATPVHFSSEPAGATVSYRGKPIGTTPFDYTVHDQFGWFSQYDFTAVLDGYQPATLTFKEKTPMDAQQVVPHDINFTLQK
jgi:hypothetical protein